MPQLELKQNPEPVRVVGDMPAVLPDEALDLVSSEVPALERTGVEQHLCRKVAKLVAKPAGERDSESHLLPADDLVGQDPTKRALEQSFPSRPVKLELRWQRRREFHQVVIEEG